MKNGKVIYGARSYGSNHGGQQGGNFYIFSYINPTQDTDDTPDLQYIYAVVGGTNKSNEANNNESISKFCLFSTKLNTNEPIGAARNKIYNINSKSGTNVDNSIDIDIDEPHRQRRGNAQAAAASGWR